MYWENLVDDELMPTFAVQPAGGGKARVLQLDPLDPDGMISEAVTVTTISGHAVAKTIAIWLTGSWQFGQGRLNDEPLLNRLPDPVKLAIVEATVGAPDYACVDEDDDSEGEAQIRIFGYRISTMFGDAASALTPYQALTLTVRIDTFQLVFEEELREPDENDLVALAPGTFLAEHIGMRPPVWWEALFQAGSDLNHDLRSGLFPIPRTFAEAVALWMGLEDAKWALDQLLELDETDSPDEFLTYAMQGVPYDIFDFDDDDWTAPWTVLKDHVSTALGVDAGIVDDAAAFASLLPADRWHEPLPGVDQRDPALRSK